MKKIFALLIISLLVVTGCSMFGSTPKDAAEKFLNNYKKNSENVITELDDYLDNEEYDDDVKKDYKELYLKQYSNLKYEIKDEKIDGDKALVEVQITVYDYYKTDANASDYFASNQSEFIDDDGDIDLSKYFQYKIKELLDTTDTIDYTITLNLTKVNDTWEVEPLTNEELQKLHGTYEY